MNEVRTRYAPSPTGFMHVGNLRTALYEYLVAKTQGGRFILRIEDTDQERQVEGALELIYRTLKRCGLQHDEGPDVGGPYAPYVQSERQASYRPIAEELVRQGHAYYCFCGEERLAQLKAEGEHQGYDRHCRDLSPEEVQARLSAGEPYVIRQRMPLEGETCFDDAVYGHICVQNSELEDQILLKSDGFPTYNFANVVDDHAMGITHVVRGSEYLSSTPKYNLLYDALGYEKPVYIHLPLIVGEDGRKLSKRHGATSFDDLIKEGYLPEVIINYLALLGWSPGTEQEIFSLQELERNFDVAHIAKSPAVFDYKKLTWFNQEYFKAMDLDQFQALCQPYFDSVLAGAPFWAQDRAAKSRVLAACLQPRLEKLGDIEATLRFLLDYRPDFDPELYAHKKMKTQAAGSAPLLRAVYRALESLPNWEQEALHQALLDCAQSLEKKNGQVMWPCRIAISAQGVTPGGASELLFILGREESLARLAGQLERAELA